MATVPNHALRQLRAGKLAIGLGVNQARTVGIASMAKTAGFDWLFIDGEHSSMDGDDAAQLSTAALGAGVTPIVRVAGFEHWHASRMLDNGAQGIVFPHVDTQEKRNGRQRLPLSAGGQALDGRRARAARLRLHAGRRGRARRQRRDAGGGDDRIAAGRRQRRRDRLCPASTPSSSAPTTCASRWASPASSTTRASRTPTPR